MSESKRQLVAIVGAGPAGLFAAKTLADSGHQVVLLNRDVKPGGLAEYGIYYTKHKMKEGLRKQFRKVMEQENLAYFGNVLVGNDGGDVTLDDLKSMGFDAILVSAGAQGTKWLGMDGEDLIGVYHAKDVVYHYNQLPPFSEHTFHFGDRVAVVGVGNVMVDIAHYAVRTLAAKEVIAVARRGPAERKYTDKEIEYVIANWDLDATRAEIERIRPRLEAVGQDADALYNELTKSLAKAVPATTDTRMVIQWLASPAAILGDENGHVRALLVDDTEIYPDGRGGMKVRNLGVQREIPCDSVVFAIGDTVDNRLGLPLNKWGSFDVDENPRYPQEGNSYEVNGLPHVFVAGWSREASTGLVGAARKDGTSAAHAVMAYLSTLDARPADAVNVAMVALTAKLQTLAHPVVDKAGWERLEAIEAARAVELGQEFFKFNSNEEMLQAIGSLSVA